MNLHSLKSLLQKLEIALRELAEHDDSSWLLEKKGYWQLYRARYLIKSGRYPEGMRCLQEAEILANQSRNDILRIKINLGKSEAFFRQGNIKDAVTVLDKVLPKIQKMGPSSVLVEVHRMLGTYHKELGNIQKAREYLTRGHLLAKELADSYQQVRVLNSLGNVYYHEGEYSQALDCYHEALSLTAHHDILPMKIYLLSNIGHIHMLLGELELAKKCYEEVKDLVLSRYGDKYFDPMDLGQVYYYQGNFAEARRYFEESLEKLKKVNNVNYMFITLFYLIFLECDEGNISKARQLLSELEQLARATMRKSFQAMSDIARSKLSMKSSSSNQVNAVKSRLQKLINDKQIDHGIRMMAALLLGEIQFEEYSSSITTDEDAERSILNWLQQLENLTFETKNTLLHVDIALLKAKFDALLGHFEDSLSRLEEIRRLCENYKYLRPLKEIKKDVEMIKRMKILSAMLDETEVKEGLSRLQVEQQVKNVEQSTLNDIERYLHELARTITRYF